MKKAKPYWEMETSELREATKEFDDPAFQPPRLKTSAQDRAQHRRAKAKNRPRRKGVRAETTP
jgi:hypothetical protein